MVGLSTGKVERNLEHVSIKDIKEIKAVSKRRAIRHLNIRGLRGVVPDRASPVLLLLGRLKVKHVFKHSNSRVINKMQGGKFHE